MLRLDRLVFLAVEQQKTPESREPVDTRYGEGYGKPSRYPAGTRKRNNSSSSGDTGLSPLSTWSEDLGLAIPCRKVSDFSDKTPLERGDPTGLLRLPWCQIAHGVTFN
ncbi:hypothetical protein RRG08_049160 [Elysia crispata]|uniref:Uncharacterized protein n=1 Tax=Elysia crispata TaxID=231223 RepID=A0AAE1ASE3_9GAST|nr:hypothetical protein RRG08_049160 [Elysia crispata]